jgi:hypothetical protein
MIKTRPFVRAIATAQVCGGLALLIVPRLLVKLLLGADLSDSSLVVLSRFFGLALLALGLACWPDRRI